MAFKASHRIHEHHLPETHLALPAVCVCRPARAGSSAASTLWTADRSAPEADRWPATKRSLKKPSDLASGGSTSRRAARVVAERAVGQGFREMHAADRLRIV